MKTAYELKDGEITYTVTGEKVATHDGEALRMARGQAEEHKESVEAWLASQAPIPEGLPEEVINTPREVKAERSSRSTPPRPAGSPELGEKDPEVIAWLIDHGTPEEKKRGERWKSLYRL